MHKSVFESGGAAPKKTNFAIGPKATMLHPAAKEIVLSGNPKARCASRSSSTPIRIIERDPAIEGIRRLPKKVCHEFRIDRLVCIQAQDPISRGFLDR